MKKEDNRLEKSEAFDWKAEIISWIKIIIAAAVIAFVLNNFIIANSKVPRPCHRFQAVLQIRRSKARRHRYLSLSG